MGSFYESYNRSEAEKLDEVEAFQELAGKYPTLGEALWGHPATKERPKAVPAMTLMLSTRDGRVRWQLSSQNADKGFGGVVRDPGDPLGSVEKSLLSRDFDEWVKKGK